MNLESEADTTAAAAKGPIASSSKSRSSSSKSSTKLPVKVKWERRKRPSTAFSPPLRSGCTMSLWAAKGLGVMFGGVTDEDTNEETLESVFWSDMCVGHLSVFF
jgi:hypothetical protein